MKRPVSTIRVGDMIRWKGWEIVKSIEEQIDKPGLCFTTHTGNGCCVELDDNIDTIRRIASVHTDVYEDGQVIVCGGERGPKE